MSNELIQHMDVLHEHLARWLAKLPPAERLEALGEVHEAIGALQRLVSNVRSSTLAELIDTHGIDVVSQSLETSPERLLRLVGTAAQ